MMAHRADSTDPSASPGRRPGRLRPLPMVALLLGAALLVRCAKSGDVSGPARNNFDVDTLGIVPQDASKPVDTLDVGTLNMSIGFPVSGLFFLDMDDSVVAFDALTDMYTRYLKGSPTSRIKAMGGILARENLDVVALQEVMVLKKDDSLVNDFLTELVAAIKDSGGPDYAVFRTVMNDTVMRGKKGDTTLVLDFREGQALLVKPGWAILDSVRFPYFSLLPIPVKGAPKTERGADYLRIESPAGTEFQVFNTHLEVFPAYGNSQASELTHLADSLQVRTPIPGQAGKGRGKPQFLLGDFNSLPGADGHRIARSRGFADTFDGVAQDSGYTCCVTGSALWAPDTTFSNRRIDFVMGRGILGSSFSKTTVKGAQVGQGGERFLASDHRMVVTRVFFQ